MNKNIEELKREYMKKEMTNEQINAMKAAMEKAKKDQARSRKVIVYRRCITAAAAAVLAFIILPNTSGNVAYAMSRIPVIGKLVEVVTFRDYQYEDERNRADIQVPELVMATKEEMIKESEEALEEATNEAMEEKLKKSMEEINAEIKEITGPFIEEFKENLQYEWGYQDILVKSEVINTTDKYFTLKLICYMASGSGAEWNYYYTIDLETGERLLLKDLFVDGADYITPISGNIKEQMREQMAADEMVYYWLEDEIEDWNFKAIQEDQTFYIDENGNIVISFNEGDVAPMYMGVVTFTIPGEVLADIRK